MACRCPRSPARALFDIFVAAHPAPTLRRPSIQAARPSVQKTQARHESRFNRKPAIKEVTPFNDPERPLDEAIGFRAVHLVDRETGRMMEERVNLKTILADIDRSKEHVRQVSATARGVPIVKIVTDASLREERDLKIALARVKPMEATKKEMELSWAIDRANDLAYRLRQLEGWLAAGRDVEILIAPKKGAKRTERAECEALVAELRAAVDRVPGASEAKMEGALGGQTMLHLKGAATGSGKTVRQELRESRSEKRAEKEKAKAEWKAELEAREKRRAERNAQMHALKTQGVAAPGAT